MVTIKDVANKARVSVTTVSRYLNPADPIRIKQETAARIDEAIATLDYSKNLNAASMKSKKSNIISLVFPHMRNTLFSEMADTMYRVLSEAGYVINTYYTYDRIESELLAVSNIRALRVEGCILVTEPYGPYSVQHIEQLLGDRIAVVLLNRFSRVPFAVSLNYRIYEAVRLAVDYLLTAGSSGIGFILGWEKQKQNQAILRAIRASFTKKGAVFSEGSVRYSHYKTDRVTEFVREFILAGVRSIFCVTDRVAIAVYDYLKQQKIRIPDDICVMVLGNSVNTRLAGLSSISLGAAEYGSYAAESLLTLINKTSPPPYRKIAPELILRR